MTKTVRGRVRGRTIELSEDLGVADGQEVHVQVTPLTPARSWGEGIRRSAGALADDPQWDDIMADVHHARKLDHRPEPDLG